MSDLNNGERQVSPVIDGIRRDHVARYEWAIDRLRRHGIGANDWVGDFACGVGYGSRMLCDAGFKVHAGDKCPDATEYARHYYSGDSDRLGFIDIDLDGIPANAQFGDAITCFETIEHLDDPRPALWHFARYGTRVLLASVPNERVFPYTKAIRFHRRHYTHEEFRDLLSECGWTVVGWYGQDGPESEVESGVNGRTIVVECRPTDTDDAFPAPLPDLPPRRVTILGLGPSLERYVDRVKRLGGTKPFTDEVWGINAVGDVIKCDRVFHMDDVRVQERRVEANPNSNIEWMLKWLRTHPGPVYTSQAVDGYPGLVEFPLEAVINDLGYGYFNSTAAYAVAYAIHIGAREINIFGCDFTYPNSHHAEKGRACVEFWLGIAAARGVKIGLPDNTTLLDTIEPESAAFYGYDAVKVKVDVQDGRATVTFDPKELPTADEVERAYDHSAHPNAHCRTNEVEHA